MSLTILIIFLAICLLSLSSFSHSPLTWQKVHSTPSEFLNANIIGIQRSDGTPLSTWIFLYFCSARSSLLPAARGSSEGNSVDAVGCVPPAESPGWLEGAEPGCPLAPISGCPAGNC